MRLTGEQVSAIWMNVNHDDDIEIIECDDNSIKLIINNDEEFIIKKDGEVE